jgi:SAM-dependent methyltransferase
VIHRPACEVCGGQQRDVLARWPFRDPRIWRFLEAYYSGRLDPGVVDGAEYEVACCRECGFVWQTHVLDDAAMALLYERWIAPGPSLAKKRDAAMALYETFAAEVQLAWRLTGRRRPADVDMLDFGMGWGHWCRMASAFGMRVTGFEVSAERLAHARGLGIHAVSDFDSLGVAAFDYINTEQVFEHIREPLRTLRALAKTLKPGGVIRISVPPDGVTAIARLSSPQWEARKDALHPLEHINCYRFACLRRLGEEAGLSLIEPVRIAVAGLDYSSISRATRKILGAARSRRSRTDLLFRKSSGLAARQ